MKVKLLKNWFDPEGGLRRADPAGVYVPDKFEDRLPKSAKVISRDHVEREAEVDHDDPNLLKNTEERQGDRAELARLQKLVDDGRATNAEKHVLKKLIEKSKPPKEGK